MAPGLGTAVEDDHEYGASTMRISSVGERGRIEAEPVLAAGRNILVAIK